MGALAIVALLVPLWGLQDAKRLHADALNKLNTYVWEGRLDLGDWCKARGLFSDAIVHFRYVHEKIAGSHPYKSRAAKALSGSWKDKKDTGDIFVRDEHARRCGEYSRKCGDLSFAAYRIARDAKMTDVATAALRDTLLHDIDHPGAREERGEVEVEPFGWVPKDEEAKWKAAPKSANFAVYTDGPDAQKALARLEELRAAFEKIFKDRFSWREGRIGVVWIRDIMEFERIRMRVPSPTPLARTGFYNHLTRVAYVTGDMRQLSHEAVHAIADTGAGSIRSAVLAAGRRADAPRDYWVIEGLARYFETLEVDKGLDRFSGPDWDPKVSIEDFTKLTFTDFEKAPDINYPIAHALVKRCLDDRNDREPFLDFVRDYYAGRGDSRKFLK
jgi:hypothetical protein